MGKFFKVGQDISLKKGTYKFKEMAPSPEGPIDKRTKELIPIEQLPPTLRRVLLEEGLPNKLANDLSAEKEQELFNQAIVSRFAVDAAKDDFARPYLQKYKK